MRPMKIVVTTSDNYLHIVPIFCHLFNKFFGSHYPVDLIGYKKPQCELPENFLFFSLGTQGEKTEFSTDLRRYFESFGDQWLIWMMEDTFIKEPVNHHHLTILQDLATKPVGRISLTGDSYKQYTLQYDNVDGLDAYKTPHLSEYRLSTQPAIWNKDFLLRYLTPGLDPWMFESQVKVVDEFENIAFHPGCAPMVHNEGVRRRDLYAYDFNGIDTTEMKQLEIL